MKKLETQQKTGMPRLLELAATRKPLILGAVILSALASIISFVPYIAIYLVIREVLGVWPDTSALDTSLLIQYGWLAFAGSIAQIIVYFLALICSHLAAFDTLYQLKVNFASHLAKIPLGFHVIMGSGKLRKIMDENIENIEKFIAHELPDIVAAFVAPIVMMVILFIVDWRLALAALVGILCAILIQAISYGKEGAKASMHEYQTALEDMNNASVEYIRGIAVVKAFKQTVYSFRRLNDTINKYTKIVLRFTFIWENSFSFFSALINHIYLFVLPVGILIAMNTADLMGFIPTLIFYFAFVPAIAGILMKCLYVNTNSMRIINGVEAMDAILAEPVLPQVTQDNTSQHHNIEFKDVSFSYDNDKEQEAITKVSFTAKQGEITAIVGPSGGGKSTIAHLIPRFFDVNEGSILLGDVDVRNQQTSSLMNQVAFVFQDVFLFKQSVMDNIRLGNKNASDEEVVAAAKAAQCHEFIEMLPHGYDTIIGTQSVHLSGGEKQRIAIARAIVKNAPVIVLDEATAFSDPENEHLIQKAFERLMHDKTVILIAHRLSSVRSADKILVMDNGRLVEQGTHDELLKADGKYATMWRAYNETTSWTMQRKVVYA